MSCPTGKLRYKTKLDARIALAMVQRKRSEKRERQYYRCDHCNGWHLTSKR